VIWSMYVQDLQRMKYFKIQFWFISIYKYKNPNENIKFFVPVVSSLTSYEFYNSILGIYISNWGARLVLVCFWDYIFRIWITVHAWSGQADHVSHPSQPGPSWYLSCSEAPLWQIGVALHGLRYCCLVVRLPDLQQGQVHEKTLCSSHGHSGSSHQIQPSSCGNGGTFTSVLRWIILLVHHHPLIHQMVVGHSPLRHFHCFLCGAGAQRFPKPSCFSPLNTTFQSCSPFLLGLDHCFCFLHTYCTHYWSPFAHRRAAYAWVAAPSMY
jgi:hypothetical protein